MQASRAQGTTPTLQLLSSPDRQHAVVERGAALGVEHAAHVQLEGALQAGRGGAGMAGDFVAGVLDEMMRRKDGQMPADHTTQQLHGPHLVDAACSCLAQLPAPLLRPTWSASMATDTGWCATAFSSAFSSLGGTSWQEGGGVGACRGQVQHTSGCRSMVQAAPRLQHMLAAAEPWRARLC